MLKSATGKVAEHLATDSHQLWEQIIPDICAAMEVLVYGAEKVTTSERR